MCPRYFYSLLETSYPNFAQMFEVNHDQFRCSLPYIHEPLQWPVQEIKHGQTASVYAAVNSKINIDLATLLSNAG